MMKIVITLVVALIGGFIGSNTKIPAGTLLGAMVAVGLINLLDFGPEVPKFCSIIAQSFLGGSLGLLINKNLLGELKNYLVPSLMIVILLSLFGAIAGIIVSRVSNIDIQTSLFGSVPGGMQEMIILSESYNVNHVAIVVMQTIRRILIVVIYPLFVNIILKIYKIKWTK